MYQALYRKWRPTTFDQVIGQEPITTTLKHQVDSGMLSHAYLFCGSRGTGKTTCSKILAKAVNCHNPQQGNPCGECPSCIGIENESILDVTEIDAASNSGVDNIRELREEANFTPVATKYRVYIIDETHMLSTGAFNALLKIMEEPPPHVLFILATTEIHKVPATILSRCQRFDFRRIPSPLMAQRLLEIAETEGATLTEDAAHLIARLSDGAMRDSISLLDLCMVGGEEITVALVESRAGLAGQRYLGDIARAALNEDSTTALQVLQDLWVYSIDYQRLTEQLLDFYRNLLVVKSVQQPSDFIQGMTQSEWDMLVELAEAYPLARVFYSIRVLSDTLERMGRTALRRTEMEVGLLKLCNPSMDTSPEALLERIETLESRSQQVISTVSADNTSSRSSEHTDSLPQTTSPNGEAPLSGDTSDTAADPGVPLPDSRQAVQPFAPWPEVLNILNTTNRALYGSLVESKAYISDDLLLVDAGNELFAEIIRSDDYARESLRTAAQTVTGTTYRLGPYNTEDFTVKKESNPLADIAKAAEALGVSMEIKE